MKIDKEQYNTIKNDIIEYSKEYRENNEIDSFSSHIDEKLSNFKPTIMVYGTYNAGKSTLLNALFGKEEMAKTGDSPETSIISDYEYNGYTIYDTPGINAPQEHEDVTSEHLKKCELILFVLSNDGSFEEKYIYERIVDIVKLNKPILLVINNKAGIEPNSSEEIEQMDKINLNLSKIGDINDIDSIEKKVEICMVHAKTALKAKLESKSLLLEKSNIKQLEDNIDNLLASAGSKEVQNSLNLYMSMFIKETLTQIDTNIDNPEMRKTQELITYVEKIKQKAEVDINTIIQESTSIATANLVELLLSKDQNKISNFINKTTKDIEELIINKVQEIQRELHSKIDTFNKEIQELSIQVQDIDQLAINHSNEIDTNVSDNNAIKNATLAGASVAVNFVPPVVPVMGVPIPAKAIAQVALAIFSAFSGSNKAAEQAQSKLDRKRAEYMGAQNKAVEFIFNYKNQLLLPANKVLENVFENTLNSLLNISNNLENNNVQLLKDKKNLLVILNELN